EKDFVDGFLETGTFKIENHKVLTPPSTRIAKSFVKKSRMRRVSELESNGWKLYFMRAYDALRIAAIKNSNYMCTRVYATPEARTVFNAHKVILAACSKNFADLFERAPVNTGQICVMLEATSADNMHALLEFMYKGEVHVSQKALESFLKAAENLQVKGLTTEHGRFASANASQPSQSPFHGPPNDLPSPAIRRQQRNSLSSSLESINRAVKRETDSIIGSASSANNGSNHVGVLAREPLRAIPAVERTEAAARIVAVIVVMMVEEVVVELVAGGLEAAIPSVDMLSMISTPRESVTTADGKKLQCPLCDRQYGYETNLRAHIRQRHQGIRVPCPYCSRTFTRNNTVRRHIAREHKQQTQFMPSQLHS
uniref:BTB domain-containing protein n=1 Tax=Anopheles christyi TaxID=43041 RepID=A0A182KEU0_9DIPT